VTANIIFKCGFVVCALVFAVPNPAVACLHPDGHPSEKLRQSAQEAIILHDRGVEDLLLRINYSATLASQDRAKAAGKIILTEQVADGSCAAKSLAPMRDRLIERWRGCYARVSQSEPELSAEVSIMWSIGRDGGSHFVEAVSVEDTKERLTRCARQVVQRWRFASHSSPQCAARVKIQFEPTKKAKPKGALRGLAWVIPVPNPPSHYAAVPARVFDDVKAWLKVRRQMVFGAKGLGAGGGKRGLLLLDAVKVGPFKIQPIQAQGPQAGRQLNAWMVKHGFKALPLSHLKHYTERNWTFLAVRMAPPKSASSLAAKGELPGLAMTFKSAKAVYPLKLSTHMGEFSLHALLVTRAQQTKASLKSALERGFEVLHGGKFSTHRGDKLSPLRAKVSSFKLGGAPAPLRSFLKKRFGGKGTLNATILVHESINADEPSPTRLGSKPAQWPSDLSISSTP